MRNRPQRLSRRAVSRILDNPSARADELGVTLSAAADPGPGSSAESEERAAVAFRSAAHPDHVSELRGTPAVTRVTRKLTAAPAAALAAAGLVLAGGGIAVAAAQGAVQVPFVGHDNRSDEAPSAPTTANPGISESEAPSGEPTEQAPAALASATPSPSLEGLCVAYQAGAMDKAASNPAFNALQGAAGGADNVASYCVDLIGEPSRPTGPARPSQAPTPTLPDAATGSHPTRPTSLPTPDVPEEPSRGVR